ncbi:hypothetical protein [Thiothrix lacustris]|uniref:hypothetical protein n=1 Tax=Thiothrix lacustris TaxID=525917 RepID=UPI0027E3C6D8|nr:hypothetical protein [Thiothrix lacustris]WMP19432.1 hypothetical protein RCS87_19270 [Thiothrix lacustris]
MELIPLLASIALLAGMTPLHADAEEWVLRRDEAGIRIHQQQTASGYAITRGSIQVDTSLDALVSVMRDRSTCPRWVYACKEGHLTKQYDAKRRLDYTVIDSPLWFADRDTHIESTTDFAPKSGILTIRLTGREDYDNGQQGRVRVKDLQGLWRFQSLEPTKTRVTYQIYSNPQLPASSLLDAYMVDSVFQTLNNLAAIAHEPPYRDAQLPDIH